jgi:hypothetical protein
MAAHPTHDLAVKTGEYTDRAGQTRGRWLRIGTVVRHDDGGTSLKLDCVPVGLPGWDGWVSVFPRDAEAPDGPGERRRREGPAPVEAYLMGRPAGRQPPGRGEGPRATEPNDDVPF